MGIGLKPQHYARALEDTQAEPSASRDHPLYRPGWYEVHPQNYFGEGGPPLRWLSAFAEAYPLSFHSVGLSLGSCDGVNREELDALASLCERFEPAMVSDHLSWSGAADDRYPDLLPLPYTRETLDHFAAQVGIVQDRLKRPILVENPSRYLAFSSDEMDEAEFLHSLCRSAGCGLLFDINNIEVSATNLGLDAEAMVDAIDPALVGEVHLAGHACEQHEDGAVLLIDDHGSPVTERTWQLFERFIRRSGPKPVLIEWDTAVPEWDVLMGEASRAREVMTGNRALHAA